MLTGDGQQAHHGSGCTDIGRLADQAATRAHEVLQLGAQGAGNQHELNPQGLGQLLECGELDVLAGLDIDYRHAADLRSLGKLLLRELVGASNTGELGINAHDDWLCWLNANPV